MATPTTTPITSELDSSPTDATSDSADLAQPVQPALHHGPPGPSVLLVDDNAELSELTAALLEEQGITVWTAEGADSAAERLADGRPDAVIVDLVMPGVHGLQLLIDLRGHPECAELPAIIISALPPGETRDRAEALVRAMGSADFIDKPATTRQLIVALGRLLTVE